MNRPWTEWIDNDSEGRESDGDITSPDSGANLTNGEEYFDYIIPDTVSKHQGIIEGSLGLPSLFAVRKSFLDLRDTICTFHSLGEKIERPARGTKGSGEFNIPGSLPGPK